MSRCCSRINCIFLVFLFSVLGIIAFSCIISNSYLWGLEMHGLVFYNFCFLSDRFLGCVGFVIAKGLFIE